jgi:tetratricopeptide (TPR) repeat protein
MGWHAGNHLHGSDLGCELLVYPHRRKSFVQLGLVLAALLACGPVFGASQNDYDDCMQHADADRTITGCTRIIDDIGESNRNRRIAYDNRGTAWHAKGKNDRAIADYTEAIELNPKDSLAYDNRGTAWRDKGDREHAFADYSTAIRLNPSNAAAYNNRGNVQREKGGKNNNKRAIADYTEAIRIDPNYAVAYCNRGKAWQASGDVARAAPDYAEALQRNPKIRCP